MNEKEDMRSQLERMVKEFSKDELDMVMALCAEEHKNRKDIQKQQAVEDFCKAFNHLIKICPEVELIAGGIYCEACGDDSGWVDVLEYFRAGLRSSDFTF